MGVPTTHSTSLTLLDAPHHQLLVFPKLQFQQCLLKVFIENNFSWTPSGGRFWFSTEASVVAVIVGMPCYGFRKDLFMYMILGLMMNVES